MADPNDSVAATVAKDDAQLAQLRDQAALIVKQPSTGALNVPAVGWTANDALITSGAVLLFGILVIAIAAYLIRNTHNGQLTLKVLATITIVTFAVFLIVIGWSDQQIAPVMGLLGTIAGYILGKDAGPKEAGPPARE